MSHVLIVDEPLQQVDGDRTRIALLGRTVAPPSADLQLEQRAGWEMHVRELPCASDPEPFLEIEVLDVAGCPHLEGRQRPFASPEETPWVEALAGVVAGEGH